jgi:hypothetical protein
MRCLLFRLGAVAFALACLAPAARAEGRRAEIRDNTKPPLFSVKAKEEAQKRLARIAEQFGLDIVIETVPPLTEKEWKALSPHNITHELARAGAVSSKVARALEKRAIERAREANIDGVWIAISTGPRHATVVVWPPERDSTLSSLDREKVRKRFSGTALRRWALAPRSEATDDEVLRQGIAALQDVLQHSGNRGLASDLSVPLLVLVFVGCWLGLMMVRARTPRPAWVATGACRARRPALLGLDFGTPAGLPAYERLFRVGPAAAPGEAPMGPLLAESPTGPPPLGPPY